MKLKEILEKEATHRLPISFQFIDVKDKKDFKIVNRYVPVKKYKSLMCSVFGYHKPISKIS